MALRGMSLWSVPPNIGRWRRNTIASPACAARRHRASSTCAWNKNCLRSQTMRNACPGYVLRCRCASHLNSLIGPRICTAQRRFCRYGRLLWPPRNGRCMAGNVASTITPSPASSARCARAGCARLRVALIRPTPAPARGSCECGMRRYRPPAVNRADFFLYLFRERPAKLWRCMERQVSEPPVVRCPGCNQPMEPKEHVFIRGRLVDIRYVCAVCGMETKRTVTEDE